MSDEYPANEVDVFLLALALGVNIVILEKRITKKNTKGFYVFAPHKKRDFIILFNQSRLEENNYNIVGKQNNYLFKLKELPGVIQKFTGVEDSENSNSEVPNSSKLKIGNKKIIKIKKK
jgi:hypothetical protein